MSTEFSEFEIAEFWSLLTESRLLETPVVEDLKNRAHSALAADQNQTLNPKTLAEWLIEQKALSRYQTNIFLGGLSGPLVYGDYLLVNQIMKGPLAGIFQARHRATGHAVVLQFMQGSDAEDAQIWQRVAKQSRKLQTAKSPNLTATYESVELPEHHFVVSGQPTGKTLAARIPLKSRIDFGEACSIARQIALGLSAMHRRGAVHGSVSAKTIWLAPGGGLQVFVPLKAMAVKNNKAGLAADVRAIGSLLYRLISGRELDTKQPDIVTLAKYKIPDSLRQTIAAMLATDPAKRITSAAEVVKQLKPFDSKRPKDTAPQATEAAYRQWLSKTNSFAIDTGKKNNAPVTAVPNLDDQQWHNFDEAGETDFSTIGSAAVDTTRIAHGRRKKSGWLIPTTAVLLIALAGLSSFLYFNFGNDVTQPFALEDEPAENEPAENAIDLATANSTDLTIADAPAAPTATVALVQELIPDDGQLLWETPTTGSPVDFTLIPPAPKILFALRPKRLAQNQQGQLLQRALGPTFNQKLSQWTEKFGMPLSQISSLTVSLHTTDEFEYEYFYVFTPTENVSRDEIFARWGQPELPNDDAKYLLDKNGTAFRFVNNVDNPEVIEKIVIGSEARMLESIELDDVSVMDGPMKKLAGWTDRDRDFSVLFLRTALFNDEGQKLMSGSLAGLNREASNIISDSVRAGLLSVHLDDAGSYLELRIDRTLDLKTDAAIEWLTSTFTTTRDRSTAFLQRLPTNSFWDPVRQRFDNMLAELVRNTRMGVEDREVIANCWLPPMALHNIVAASELTLTFADSADVDAAAQTVKQTPQSLKELLAAPRDLTVSTSPDLIRLLSGLQNEIRDEYPSLPFDFTIRLLGKDLGAEGITQNQRPNDFAISQRPLSEILTEIMVQANPDKNITGASDPNCKLVWVAAEDPENAGTEIILITTRKAAAEKSYDLPAAFVEN